MVLEFEDCLELGFLRQQLVLKYFDHLSSIDFGPSYVGLCLLSFRYNQFNDLERY